MLGNIVTALATNIVGNQITTRYSEMATPSSPYVKDLGNILYHGAVIGGLSVAYSMILKKVAKVKPADLGRLDLEDGVKTVGTVALALWTQDMLVKQGLLPDSIIKSS